MHSQRQRRFPGTEVGVSADPDPIRTAIEGVVIRNHDQDRAYTCRVFVRSPDGERVCDRTVSIDPAATMRIALELERGVYRVEALHDAGGPARADCLIGGDPAEHATIETGNGVISVMDGSRRY